MEKLQFISERSKEKDGWIETKRGRGGHLFLYALENFLLDSC